MNDAEVREHVLDEAKKCVLKDRNSTYGKPEDNFSRIAKLWEAYDEIRKPGPETPTDVAIKMTLMKIARLAHNPTHKDSWVDGIGYLACGAGIEIAEDLISRQSVLEGMIAQSHDDAQMAIPTAKKPDTVHIPGIGECVITKQSDIQDFMNIAKAIRRGEAKLQACQTPSTSSDSQS